MGFKLENATVEAKAPVSEPTAKPVKKGFDLSRATTEQEDVASTSALISQNQKQADQQQMTHTVEPLAEELPLSDQVFLSASSNLREQELYLKKKYPKAKVEQEQDEEGNVRLSVTGGPSSSKVYTSEGFMSSLIADSPELAGSIAGASTGAAYGAALGLPGAAAGSILGAGIGALGGKAAKETAKAAVGIQDKTFAESMQEAQDTVVAGSLGEGGGRVVAKGLNMIRKPLPKLITGATDKTKDLTERTLKGGAIPSVSSYAPNAKKLIRYEVLANKLVGPSEAQRAANTKFMNDRVGEILTKAGVPGEKVPGMIEAFASGKAKTSTREIGEQIQQGAQAKTAAVEAQLAETTKQAEAQLDNVLGRLNTKAGKYAPGDLSPDVAEGIRVARKDFQTSASKVYAQVDKLAGNQPIVPTQLIKKQLDTLAQRFPKVESFGQLRTEIAEYGENITFRQAQDLRSRLNDLAQATDLTPGVSQHELGKLADTVDRSFDLAARLNLNTPAVKMLRAADNFYRKGVQKFHDTTINRLVDVTKAGMPPDPVKIANLIVEPGQSARVGEIRKLVGEPVFKRVASQDYLNMLEAATAADGNISGKILLKQLNKRGKLVGMVHGEATANDLRQLAEGLATKDRYISPEALQPGNLKNALVSLRESEKAADNYMKTNFLADLADPAKEPEQVFSFLSQPGNESRLSKAVKAFGEDSSQIQGLRQHATGELVRNVKFSSKNNGAEAIRQSLDKYTKQEQELLFPHGLSKDIQDIADEVEFLFPKESDESMAGFTAGSILQKVLPTRIYEQLHTAAWRTVLHDPRTIRRIALGLHTEKPATRRALREMIRYSVLESSDEDPEEQQ